MQSAWETGSSAPSLPLLTRDYLKLYQLTRLLPRGQCGALSYQRGIIHLYDYIMLECEANRPRLVPECWDIPPPGDKMTPRDLIATSERHCGKLRPPLSLHCSPR